MPKEEQLFLGCLCLGQEGGGHLAFGEALGVLYKILAENGLCWPGSEKVTRVEFERQRHSVNKGRR